MTTSIPFFIIHVPAMFIHGKAEEVAEGEKYWALAGLVVCLIGFVSYLPTSFASRPRAKPSCDELPL